MQNGYTGQRDHPGGMLQEGMGFHHATQKSVQFKNCEMFISGIFHLLFLYCTWLCVTETVEGETTDREKSYV